MPDVPERRIFRRLGPLGPITTALLIGLLTRQPAHAVPDKPGDQFHFDAFGTFGLAVSDLGAPLYRTNYVSSDGVGTHPDAKFDTRAGVQLGWTFNDRFDFNVQGLLNNDANDITRVHVSWAYLRAQLAPDWSMKLGRFRLLTYLYADTLDVGYSYPWVRLPADMYATSATFHSSDGVLLQYRLPLANGYLRVEPYISHATDDKTGGATGSSQIDVDLGGISASLTQGSHEWFAAFSRTKLNLNSAAYDKLINTCASLYGPACNDYTLHDVFENRFNLGWRYDDTRWMFAAELVDVLPQDTLGLGHEVAGYASMGRYFGAWLPYITYSRLRVYGQQQPETRFGPLNPAFSALNNRAQQHTWSVGARWDVKPGIALKAQLDNAHPDKGSAGLFTGPMPAGTQSANIVTITLDWTY